MVVKDKSDKSLKESLFFTGCRWWWATSQSIPEPTGYFVFATMSVHLWNEGLHVEQLSWKQKRKTLLAMAIILRKAYAHCFDADLDMNFHFDADLNPDPDWQIKKSQSTQSACGSYRKFYAY